MTPPIPWAVLSSVWPALQCRNSSWCPPWTSCGTAWGHFLLSLQWLPQRWDQHLAATSKSVNWWGLFHKGGHISLYSYFFFHFRKWEKLTITKGRKTPNPPFFLSVFLYPLIPTQAVIINAEWNPVWNNTSLLSFSYYQSLTISFYVC